MAAKFQLVSEYPPAGDQPKAIEQLVAGFADGKNVPGAARRHRHRQDVHRRQRHRRSSASRRSCSPTTRRSPPSSTRSSRASSRTTPSTTSSATTTTTSPRRTSRSATSTSRRTPRSTRTSTASASPPPAPSSAARTSSSSPVVSCIYGLGSPSDYKRMMVHLAKGEVDRPRQPAPAARRHPVPAQRHRLRARQVPRPRRHHRGLAGLRGVRASASSCSATRSTPCPSSTRPPARRSSALDELYIYPAKHFVTPEERVTRGRSRASSRN